MLITSVFVELIHLEVESDFLQVAVVFGFGGIMNFGCLMDVKDHVPYVDFLQVD